MSYLNKKPVVYFVFCKNSGKSSTRFGGFARRLIKAGNMPDAEYKCVALQQMIFAIDTKNQAVIYSPEGQRIFDDAAYVYFKSWESMPEQAAMAAHYLKAKGIPFGDTAVERLGVNKASQMWRLWANNICVIPTITSCQMPSEGLIEEALGSGPYIIKPAHGEKGHGIEKIRNYQALHERLAGNERKWLVQPFVKNNGDLRMMVYGFRVRGVLKRVAASGAIVNNTSQGASSEYLEPSDVAPEVRRMAVRAARVTENAVAGVDVIENQDGKWMVMEVNQGSQIVTGHFTDKKMAAFGDYMQEVVVHRQYRQKQSDKLAMMGRYVHVNLPDLGAKNVFAKVDTGAYQSAIHATDIQEIATQNGPELQFRILTGHRKTGDAPMPLCHASEYEKAVVRNSFGIAQNRYIIKTRVSVNGRMMKTGITLTDRKDMVAPLLLGRRFLRGRYMVNVELSRVGFERSL
jgi:glutathione synthase/RimK-type ligase-like ATP-grasp enzyme